MLVQEIITKNDLREFIQTYIDSGRRSSLRTSISNSSHLKRLLKEFTPKEPDLNYTERACLIYNNLEERPLCAHCEEKKTNLNRNDWKFMRTCSVKCAANDEQRKEKIEKTSIERYGATNIWGSEKYREMAIQRNRKKYGVDWYMQTEDFKEKSQRTAKEIHNVDFIQGSYTSIENRKKTCVIRYGSENWYQSEDCKKRIAEKYGVSHCMQVPEILEKQLKSAKRKKDYFFPSGRKVSIQGYENLALDMLLETHNENDIFAGSEVFHEIGTFEYAYKGKKKRYFPDIYIKSKNLVIEVKSSWTLKLHYELNKEKLESVKERGFDIEFWVFGKEGFSVIKALS